MTSSGRSGTGCGISSHDAVKWTRPFPERCSVTLWRRSGSSAASSGWTPILTVLDLPMFAGGGLDGLDEMFHISDLLAWCFLTGFGEWEQWWLNVHKPVVGEVRQGIPFLSAHSETFCLLMASLANWKHKGFQRYVLPYSLLICLYKSTLYLKKYLLCYNNHNSWLSFYFILLQTNMSKLVRWLARPEGSRFEPGSRL